MTFQAHMILPDQPIEQEVRFRSGEFTLYGRLFVPSVIPDVVVILNPATGVAARFYHAFARWLAETKGYACLTYDYRGFGASDRGQKGRTRLSDWAVHDAEAARTFIEDRFKGSKIWVIGHSLGALALPFQQRLDRIDRVIGVASGMVHVSDHPLSYQWLARLFWFGHVPLIVKAMGRLPAWAGFGENLPGQVYWQWRKWCTKRSFFAEDFGRAMPMPDWNALTAPMKFVAIADDPMVPPAAVWRLMQCYPRSYKSQLVLRPEDYDLSKIGHIQVFSRQNQACWEAIVA